LLHFFIESSFYQLSDKIRDVEPEILLETQCSVAFLGTSIYNFCAKWQAKFLLFQVSTMGISLSAVKLSDLVNP
jgi:hypothetical protein